MERDRASYHLHGNNIVLTDEIGKKYILKIKDLPDEDKPRERLVKYGANSLSASELLAIVLNTGTKKEGILEMSKRIFKEYGEKAIINQTDPKIIEKELDIPLTKACQIVACFSLGQRLFSKDAIGQVTIRTAKQAFQYLKDMRDLPKEQLRGLYLNSRYRLIHDEVISIGSLTANIVHPREIFKPAIAHSAAAVIIAHNHPSGSTKPTKSDITVTEQLIKASQLLGIDLLDHIIIAKDKFSSIIDKHIS